MAEKILCEINGVPVLTRDEQGCLHAPEGLEGIAAYFESKGIPEDVYGSGESRERHAEWFLDQVRDFAARLISRVMDNPEGGLVGAAAGDYATEHLWVEVTGSGIKARCGSLTPKVEPANPRAIRCLGCFPETSEAERNPPPDPGVEVNVGLRDGGFGE